MEGALGRSLALDVAAWAAVVSAETVEQFGAARDISALPDNQRRRLPAFARDVIRCTLPLLAEAPSAPIILAASHGDMHSTLKLLTDLANQEILSPSLFALSVLNAAPGAMSLALDAPGDQTALSAGHASLSAALTEAYAQLAEREVDAVVIAYAAPKLPAIYDDLDEPGPGIFLSALVRNTGGEAQDEIGVGFGRAGSRDVVHALSQGVARLAFDPPAFGAPGS